MPEQSKESVISERDPHAKREVHEKKKRRGKRRARSAEVTPRNHAAVSPYEMKQTKSTMQQPRSASTMIPDSEFTSSPSLDEPDSQFAEESPLSGEVQEVD